jgi:hypothetical protein
MAARVVKESLGNASYDLGIAATKTDWFLMGYERGSKTRIVYVTRGSGGLDEIANQVTEEMVRFGYLRVCEEPAVRDKNFDDVMITFIGKWVKPQERARAVSHRLDVQEALPSFTCEFEAYGKANLSMERLRKELAETKARIAEIMQP